MDTPINVRLHAHQNILTLGETDGDLSGLAADVHQLRIHVGDSLSEEEDGVFVLLTAHPEEKRRKPCQQRVNSESSIFATQQLHCHVRSLCS